MKIETIHPPPTMPTKAAMITLEPCDNPPRDAAATRDAEPETPLVARPAPPDPPGPVAVPPGPTDDFPVEPGGTVVALPPGPPRWPGELGDVVGVGDDGVVEEVEPSTFAGQFAP